MPATVIDYPRPHLVHDHTVLFQEPAWPDGSEPLEDEDDEDE